MMPSHWTWHTLLGVKSQELEEQGPFPVRRVLAILTCPVEVSGLQVIARLGKEINHPDSIYYWAWKNNIPVFCPALTGGWWLDGVGWGGTGWDGAKGSGTGGEGSRPARLPSSRQAAQGNLPWASWFELPSTLPVPGRCAWPCTTPALHLLPAP